jgi:hypothetical protein
MLKNNTNIVWKIECKKKKKVTSKSSTMEKTGTFPDETIHITPRCVVHLHGHQNKIVLFMKPFILVDFSNGDKFCNYIC